MRETPISRRTADEIDDLVVVGTGAVSPFGNGVEALWDGLKSQISAIRPVPSTFTLPGSWIAGQVPNRGSGKGAQDPAIQFGKAATAEALSALGDPTSENLSGLRWGVVFGSCNGALSTAESAVQRNLSTPISGRVLDELRWISPQAMAEAVASSINADGPVHSVNTACASGAHALMHGCDLLRSGSSDVMLVGGSDALSRIALVGFSRLGALAPSPARPYAADREGMSLGEGAAALVICHRSLARERGLTILASILGIGASADAYHLTDPHPEGLGAARAITQATSRAGMPLERIGYVNGHGTGTAKNDIAEDAAIRLAFAERTTSVSLSSTKGMTGHLLGAAGVLEAVVVIESMRRSQLPASVGVDVQDPKIDSRVIRKFETAKIENGMSNSFAFGGANACIVFGHPSDSARFNSRDTVVVTGCAALTPMDESSEDLIERYRKDSSGTLERYLIDLDLAPESSERSWRRTDRAGSLLAIAAARAIRSSGVPVGENTGLFVGTGYGPSANLETFIYDVLRSPQRGGGPRTFANTVYNAPAGHATKLCDLRGPTSTLTGDLSSGLSALILAAEAIAHGRADAIVVGGFEVNSTTAQRFARRNAGREKSARFHEASTAVVLERRSSAEARGANVLAEVKAHGGGRDQADQSNGRELAISRLLPSKSHDEFHLWDCDSVASGELSQEGPWATALRKRAVVSASEPFQQKCGSFGGSTSLLAVCAALTEARHSGPQTKSNIFASSSGTGTYLALLLEILTKSK